VNESDRMSRVIEIATAMMEALAEGLPASMIARRARLELESIAGRDEPSALPIDELCGSVPDWNFLESVPRN
jgi:hypothetical protein